MTVFLVVATISGIAEAADSEADGFRRLRYGDTERIVDLGVGLWAWPLPVDGDGDGDLDLLVSCPDVPSGGCWYFENLSGAVSDPVFAPAVRKGPGASNVQVSYLGGEPRILTPGEEHPRALEAGLGAGRPLPGTEAVDVPGGKIRANQWKLVDWEADGDLDLLVGVGDWADYGWDDAFDAQGRWQRGPLHGRVWLWTNEGTDAAPRYEGPAAVEAGGEPVDVYGMPSPNLADLDGDGDLDLICGEFLDGLTWFENTGRRDAPRFAGARPLRDTAGEAVRLHLQMIVPVAVDFDGDGDIDLVVGQEDGRVALVENTGELDEDGEPSFRAPSFFRQEARWVKYGALVTPAAADWDADGDEDLVCGNTAGSIAWIENLDGGDPPRWAPPVELEAGGEPIRIQAGTNGSIQGPCEAKWGYTTLDVVDWDHDGRLDILANSILGRVIWYRNRGTPQRAVLEAARPVEVDWEGSPPKPAWNWWDPEGKELVTQWRTRPVGIDWTGDGLCDLVVLDHEGYLALFERSRDAEGALHLRPGKRVFVDSEGHPLRLAEGRAGRSGRRKIAIGDWDQDGRRDLLVNGANATWWRNTGERDGETRFVRRGPVAEEKLAGHSTSPALVDWDRNGIPDLLLGAEDGRFYHRTNPRGRHTFALWPQGVPDAPRDNHPPRRIEDRSEGGSDRHVRDVHLPTLTVWRPAPERATGAAVVVCPGGGYALLAIDKEGHEVGRWLAAQGVTGLVLEYRLPRPRGVVYGREAPLRDAQRALRMARARHEEWGIDPERIGILGFSAGGHLAATAATRFDDPPGGTDAPLGDLSCRPDFVVLVYPVVSFRDEFGHTGSRDNLLGASPSEELVARYSAETSVTASCPPAFLVHATDDPVSPRNSIAFYLACRRAGVPAELHLFARGGHGYGLRAGHLAVGAWPELCVRWLRDRGVLPSAEATSEGAGGER